MWGQVIGVPELLVADQAGGADIPEGPSELVMVGIAIRQPVVVDEDLQLALAHRRIVQMRHIVNSGAGRMHGGLINQMQFPEHLRITGDLARQNAQIVKEWRVRRPVFLRDGIDDRGKARGGIFAGARMQGGACGRILRGQSAVYRCIELFRWWHLDPQSVKISAQSLHNSTPFSDPAKASRKHINSLILPFRIC